jgi:cytochrome c oxidase subunit 2
MQENAWIITVVLIGLLALIFLRVLWTSNREAPYEEVSRRAYAFRGGIFWLVIIAGVIITLTTLNPWPHAGKGGSADAQVVDVTGVQWSWRLSQTRIKAGVPVEFRVTSGDVNHGFGVYDASMRMLAQVQAMPGYINKLRYTFEQAGEYRILCMEYCGVAHHGMMATLTVLPAGE